MFLIKNFYFGKQIMKRFESFDTFNLIKNQIKIFMNL